MPPPKNNNKPKLKDEIVDYNSIKFGIRIPESQNGDSLFMKNPQSSATGLYGQKYSELKKLPEYKDISRDEFAKDTVLQNKVFDDRFNGKLKDIPGLKKTGEDLYNEYKKSTKYNATQIAAISNLLGRYGTKKYLGYVERDGKTLEEVFPNKYGDKIKVKNKTPDEYLEESKLIKKPIVKPAKPINKSVQPINKPIKPSNKKLEDNDSWLENIVEFVDPTGITSYDDVYRSYKNTGLSGETALEALGALPLIGKIGKSGKVISGGFGLLQDTVKAAQYLPSKQQKQVVDKAFDLYQKYSKSGGKEFDELLGSSTKFIKDNVNLLNPEMVKSSDKLINAYNTTFKTGKAYDAYQAATGSKNNSGLKRTDDGVQYNGRNIMPNVANENMYKFGGNIYANGGSSIEAKRDATLVVGNQPKPSFKENKKNPVKDISKDVLPLPGFRDKPEDTELIKLIKERQIKPRGPKQPYELASGAVTPTASPIDAAVVGAAGIPQLVGRGVAGALPYLDAPLTVGSKVLPFVTANNLLNAAGAAYSGEQIINPESDLRTNPNAENILMTGLGLVGLPYKAAGLSFADDLGQVGKYLTEETVLKNAYKINPWAFKPNPEAYYRMIGNEGYADALESGVLRSNPGKGGLQTQQFDDVYFSMKHPWDGRNYGYVTKSGEPIGGVGYKGPYMAELTGQELNHPISSFPRANMAQSKVPISLENPGLKLYKQDWLRGYKPIKVSKPTTNSNSVAPVINTAKNLEDLNAAENIPKTFDELSKTAGMKGFNKPIKKPSVSNVDKIDNTDEFKNAIEKQLDEQLDELDKEIYKFFEEQKKLDALPETKNKESLSVLEDFKTRIQTPEGKKRIKELGIDNDELLQKIKIVEDPNTFGYYAPIKNKIVLNPYFPLPKKVTRHEIEHAVQHAFQTPKTTKIDDLLSGLELKKQGTPNKQWDYSKIVNDSPVDISQYKSLISNEQNATDYFLTGSGGKERSAFLSEIQQYMMDQGILPKTSYAEVTPEIVKNTFVDAMFDETGGGKYLRLFNIMKPTEANYKLISEGLNKMLGLTPYLGTGYLGYKGLQGQEKISQKQEYKYGGNIPMKLNKYNYGKNMYFPYGGASILTQSNLETGEAKGKKNTVLDKESMLNTQPIISNNEINKNINATNISSPTNFNIPSFQSKTSSFDNSNFTGSFNSNPIVGETSNFSKSLDNSFAKIDSAPSIQAPALSDPLPTMDMSTAAPPTVTSDQLGLGPELNANTNLNFTAEKTSKKPLNSSGVYSGNYAGMASAAVSGIANTVNNVNQAKTSDDKFNAGTKGSVDTVMNVVDTAFPIVGMVESAASVAPTISNMTNPKTTVYDKKTGKSYTYQTGKNGDVAAAWSAVGSPRDNLSNAIGSFAGTKENYGMNDVAMGIADMFVPFLSEGVRNKKAREAAQSANIDQLNPEEYNRSMKVSNKNILTPESNQARYGGKMFSYGGNIYANGGMTMYNMPKGLTHEQHPYGGYPIGNNNYVESDEVVLDKPDGSKYIFSNRIKYKI